MQSKCTSGRKESNSLAAMSFRREGEVVSSLSKNTELIAPRGQPAQTDVSSDCNSIVGTDVSDSNARKKSKRRKSFTLLLMARSKVEAFSFFLSTPLLLGDSKHPFFFFLQLIDEHMGLMKQEGLPSIYDDGNHLEVAEYIDEIYQYYWISEVILYSTLILFLFFHSIVSVSTKLCQGNMLDNSSTNAHAYKIPATCCDLFRIP